MLYILATVKRTCLKRFYTSGYCAFFFFFPPLRTILELPFAVLGTSPLSSARRAEQVLPGFVFALAIKPDIWKHGFCGNAVFEWLRERRDQAGGILRPGSPPPMVN